MIATIIDIVASRDVESSERKEMDEKIRSLLEEVESRFRKYSRARPSLTQGDPDIISMAVCYKTVSPQTVQVTS
ncbi:MAG: hypothetical protein ACOC38_04400 [Promethearchaeia archaeon]